jgi:anti-anti-sigma factor
MPPIEQWSDRIRIVHLADDPQLSDDLHTLEKQSQSSPADALVNFASVNFLGSSNLARLLKLRKLLVSQDRRLMLCSVNTNVWGTFLVTGLDKVFEFADDVPTGLAALQM